MLIKLGGGGGNGQALPAREHVLVQPQGSATTRYIQGEGMIGNHEDACTPRNKVVHDPLRSRHSE